MVGAFLTEQNNKRRWIKNRLLGFGKKHQF